MNYLRSFFASIYGVIFFTVVLIVLACAVLSTALPLVMRFEIQIARPSATVGLANSPQIPPTTLPVTIMPSLIAATTPLAVAPTISSPEPSPSSMPTREPTVVPTSELLPPTALPTAAITTTTASITVTQLLDLINQLRATNGCQPLQLDTRLQQAAQAHAQDMRDTRKLDHTGSDGATLRDRLDRVGYPYQRAGENITSYFATPQDVMKQWTEGDEIPDGPHRKNILNCVYAQAGIGLAYRDDGYPYWVLDLASRKP
jgi:uncharacterized protein YkwD